MIYTHISSPSTFLSSFLLVVSGKKYHPLSRLYSSPRRSPCPPPPLVSPRTNDPFFNARFLYFPASFFSTLSLSLCLSTVVEQVHVFRTDKWFLVFRGRTSALSFCFHLCLLSSSSSSRASLEPLHETRFPGALLFRFSPRRNARLPKSNFALSRVRYFSLARIVRLIRFGPLCGLLELS